MKPLKREQNFKGLFFKSGHKPAESILKMMVLNGKSEVRADDAGSGGVKGAHLTEMISMICRKMAEAMDEDDDVVLMIK